MIKSPIVYYSILLFFITASWLSGQITETIGDSAIVSDTAVSPGNGNDTGSSIIDTNSASALEKEPELKKFIKAAYPDSLIASGREGTVTLELLVNERGLVDSVKVTEKLHPILDALARKAASQFVFTPGIADGKPVPVYLTYDYNFTLDEIISEIEEYINLSGKVREKGARKPVADAAVSLIIGDTAEASGDDSARTVAAKAGRLPMKRYLEKIGSFSGQSLEGGRILTTTDSSGNFSFKSIPPGKAYLRIAAPGFETYDEELDMQAGEEVSLTAYLDRVVLDEFEITVYGKAEKKEITRRTLQVREAKRVPGFSGDAVKAVQALPGVARPVFGSTEVVLRGADWGDNKYYIDGVEIPYLWHDVGNNCVLNSNLIEKVDLYPGGFGAKYGDALGGIIEIESRTSKQDSWHCIADMNLSYSSLVLDVPVSEKLSFTGSIRREYYMYLAMKLIKATSDLDLNYDLYYWDYSLRLDYTPSAGHHIFCQFMSARDRMIVSMPEREVETDMDYDKLFKLGIAGWDWTISDVWKNSIRYGLSPLSSGFDFSGNNIASNYDLSGYEHTVRDELQWSANDRLKVKLGLDLHLEPTDIAYSYTGKYFSEKNFAQRDTSYTINVDFLNGSVGGYLSCEIKPFEKLVIIPEYRLDYYPGLNYAGSLLPEFWNYEHKPTFRWSHEPSLRIASRFNVAPDHTVKASAGTYNKSPSYDANDNYGNPALEPGRGSQYTLGYEWQITDLISFDCIGYLNRQWNKSQWVNALELGEGYDEGQFRNRGKGRMRGIEFFLRHNQGKRFSGWLGYTLAYSERYDSHEKKWIVFDRNILNNLQLVSSLNIRKNMNLGLRFQYTDGYPYTPARRLLYYDASQFMYVPEWGETNSKKHDPFLEIDFRFEKKIAFRKSIMTFYVGCDRILHFLQFIEKDNGEPLYYPTEMPTYNYDYSGFEGIANFPGVTFGLSVEL